MTRRKLKPKKATRVTFCDFVRDVLGVDLTAGQRVLCAVAFDGLDPIDLDPADRKIARTIFGDVDRVPDAARHVLVAVLGARVGKTYLLIALRAVHLALTCDVSRLADGELAFAVIIARDLRLSQQALRYALGAARKLGRGVVQGETKTGFDLVRPDGARVRFETLPASHGGAAGRGRSLVFAGLDEAAFFQDSDHKVNDEDVYQAVAPRVLPDGQLVIASTPWAEGIGLVWSFYDREHGNPETAIVAHAPTAALRDDPSTLAQIERERVRNPDNWRREYSAEFVAGGSSQWFDSNAIKACTVDRPRILAPRGDHRRVSVGVDLGFRSDASACVILHHDEDGAIHVAETIEIKPDPGSPLVPSVVVARFAEAAIRHGASTLVGDLVYFQSLEELAAGHGLRVMSVPTGPQAKIATYTQTKAILAEQRLSISPDDRDLLRQLAEVVGTPTSGGGLSITSPRRQGSHGDLVSALVCALWYAEEQRRFYSDERRTEGVRVRIFGHDGEHVDKTVDTRDHDDEMTDEEIRRRFYDGEAFDGARGGQREPQKDNPLPDLPDGQAWVPFLPENDDSDDDEGAA